MGNSMLAYDAVPVFPNTIIERKKMQVTSIARIIKRLKGLGHEDSLADTQVSYHFLSWLRFNIRTSLYESVEISKRKLLAQT
jgi:hypothetical protein